MSLKTEDARGGSRDLPSGTGSAAGAPRVALVLPGGGARSAYQVGVLRAIASWCPPGTPLPFRVLCGTSAGAILAAVLASYAPRFRQGTAALERVWRHFRVEQVFRTDPASVARSAAQVLLAVLSGGWLLPPPRSLFDNAPLRHLLEWRVNFARIRQYLDAGHFDALAITATSFATGEWVSFIDASRPLQGWERPGQRGVAAELRLDHLMASAAIPFLFPPVRMMGSYFGDGAMRQTTPLAPALRLGADRILVIGVREPGRAPLGASLTGSPSFGQVFGFMLDTLFAEGLDSDLERLERINELLARAPGADLLSGMRRIDALVLRPQGDLSAIAATHAGAMPRSVRALLRTMGASGSAGGQLSSFLLFESAYTRPLIEMGFAEAQARREEICAFLGLGPAGASEQEQRAEAQQRGEADHVGDRREDHASGQRRVDP
jgi:NTE family protein